VEFEQLLMTLSVMALSTECLSYEEIYHIRERGATDRAAKIVTCALASWHRKRHPPVDAKTEDEKTAYRDLLHYATVMRLDYICNVYKKVGITQKWNLLKKMSEQTPGVGVER
jgi:hypothetical protein